MGNLLSKMKSEISKTGGSKSKIIYVKDGGQKRVRFLVEFDDGLELTFHDSFERGINALCGELYGKSCPLCEDEGLRTRKQYLWPVWDYDAKEVRFLMYAANNCTPVPALIGMYEIYGTMCDRDYVIKRTGTQKNTTYSVIPMDKGDFRNKDAKVPTEAAIIKTIAKAFPMEGKELDDDEEEVEDKHIKVVQAVEQPAKVEDEDVVMYDEMSAKELYKLCISRGIEAKKKQKEEYYIDLLEDADAEDDEDEDNESDEW